jgi:phosphohistidine phosphatase
MDLILWRHADALEPQADQHDQDRELSAKGERQAARMAKWLDRQLPEGARIYCSPAKRALQTVQCLGRKYKLRDELSPQCDHTHVLGLVQWPNAKMTTLVVGHQPALGQTIAELMGMPELALSMRKGSVWWLRSKLSEGQHKTVLVTVQSPEML